MKALLLCNYEPFGAATITEHINAIIDHSSFDVFVYNDLVSNSGELHLSVDIDDFDVIIVHYSIFLAIGAYCSVRTKAALKRARGIKVAFLQDEYRFVNRSIDAMHAAGIDIIFTCVPEASIEFVYPPERMQGIVTVNTLTGYIPEFLAQLKPKELRKRRYDVSYRGRRYPDWHGSMGREKQEIAENFLKHSRGHRLRTNISCKEKHRLYGAKWIELIQNSRAVLGVESGASVFDFSGLISSRTETIRNLLGRKGITYEDMRNKYFSELENTIDLSQISPRVFEAMSLRTLCILYEGEYSGVVEANVHYLPLKKDFSNFDEVAAKLKDKTYVAEIISNAYTDVIMQEKYSYPTFIKKMDEKISEVFKSKFPNHSRRSNKKGADTDKQSLFQKAQEYRLKFLEAHPFNKVSQPHGLAHAQASFLRSTAQFVKSRLPFRIQSTLKSLIK